MKRIACALSVAVAAVSASATDYSWSGKPASYTSPRAAAWWCDTALWGGSGYPNAAADTATFNPATTSSGTAFFITNNVAVEILRSSANGNADNLCYVGEQPISFCAKESTVRLPWVYAPTVIGGGKPYFINMRFCGDLDVPSGRTFMFHGSSICHLHYDRYATAAGEVREVPAWLGAATSYDLSLQIYAPESSSVPVTNKFSQVTGSPYLQRTANETGALSVGTAVTGAGIPAGTFLKRVFPQRNWIELSNPVTTTATDNALEFAAFSPKVHHRIASFEPNNSVNQSRFYLGKYGAADEMVVELDNLRLYTWAFRSSDGVVSDRAVFFDLPPADDGDAPAYPARVVIHKVTEDNDTNVQLGTCDILFSTTTSGLGPGFPRSTIRQPSATAEAQLSVTGAMTATICEIQNFKGTIVKAGSGTLRVGFTTNQVANTGCLVVKEGVFEVANPGEGECKSADDIPTVGSLEIASGATLRLPTRGLRVTGVLTVAEGGIIEGATTLHCGAAPRLNGAVVSPTVTISLDANGAAIHDIPAPATESTLPGEPAFWVDCSQTNTMTLVALDHTEAGCASATQYSSNGVYRINDVRKKSDADKYLFSTNCAGASPSAHMPLLQYDKNKDLHHVYFHGNCLGGNVNNTTKAITNTDAHAWSQPVAGIRVLFEVYGGDGSDADGGTTGTAPLLGATSYKRNSAACPKGKYFPGVDCWGRYSSGKHCFLSWASLQMQAGAFFVNGEKKIPGPFVSGIQRAYPPYGSPMVSDLTYRQKHCYRCHPFVVDMTIPETWSGSPTTPYSHVADAYTFTPSYCQANTTGIEKKRLFELIVYTNELTEAQIVSVRRYLMRKWLSQDAPVSFHEFNTNRLSALDAVIEVQAGETNLAETVGANAAFTMKGAGTIVVEDAYAPEADVTVSSGTLQLRSLDLTRPPTNAEDRVRILLDASQADSDRFVLEEDAQRGVQTVKTWKDLSPNKVDFSLWQSATTNRPFLVANALNGLSVIDFGSFLDVGEKEDVSKSCPALTAVDRLSDCHAVLAVWGSAHGGGSLLGQALYHYNELGLSREKPKYGGSKDDPILYNPGNSNCKPFGNASSYLCRRNGTSVNPTQTGLSGAFDLVSYMNWSPFAFQALQICDNNDRRWMGGGQYGEILVLDVCPSPSHLDDLEAYFRKKWFDIDTDGYREASLKSLAVASGATVEVAGGVLHLASLASAGGTLNGRIDLASDAELTVTVNGDGSVTPLALNGTIDLSKGGTVKLAGATGKLAKGEHILVTGVGDTASGNWTVDTTSLRKKYRRDPKVYVREGNLCLCLNLTGVVFTVK